MQSCGVDRGWGPAGTLFLNSSSSGVDSGANTVFTERWGGSDFSTSGAGTSKAIFWTLLGRPHQLRKTLKNQ